jgi:ABC-type transport system substrate-binding protein
MNALSYSNSSNTVTFKLLRPTVPQLIFTAVADFCGAGIISAHWLNEVGAGITFTPAGFYAYQNEANFGSFNLKVQWDPVASGPYMIESVVLGQSITLVPNPGFPGLPGIPAVNSTVVIEYVKDAETTYDLFASGQADMVGASGGGGLPSSYVPLVLKLISEGEAAMYECPFLNNFFDEFNLDINVTDMKAAFGSQYNIPSDYFTNLDVREAFAYAFNYTNEIDEILGNKKYGIDFGSSYAGMIIPGLPDYVPASELQNVPIFDLIKAKQLLQESGEYGVSVNIPIAFIAGATDLSVEAQMWASAVNSIDPNIVMTPVAVPYNDFFGSYLIPGQNPMPIAVGNNWIADYPYPSDFVDGMYKEGGYFTASYGWSVQYLNSTGHPDQATTYAEMNSLIQTADTTTNATLAAQDYRQAEQLAINLYMYVYTYIPNAFLLVKPYMSGYQGQIQYEQNPMQPALYFWWVKACQSTQACSGRSIGP